MREATRDLQSSVPHWSPFTILVALPPVHQFSLRGAWRRGPCQLRQRRAAIPPPTGKLGTGNWELGTAAPGYVAARGQRGASGQRAGRARATARCIGPSGHRAIGLGPSGHLDPRTRRPLPFASLRRPHLMAAASFTSRARARRMAAASMAATTRRLFERRRARRALRPARNRAAAPRAGRLSLQGPKWTAFGEALPLGPRWDW